MADDDEQGRDWRAAECYRPLLEADASAWAWEFARRAPVSPPSIEPRPPDLCFAGPGPGAALVPVAMWRFESDATIPLFEGVRADGDDDHAIDIGSFPLATLVVSSEAGDQHVLVVDGLRRLRFAVVGANVLEGPVRLGFVLPSKRAGLASIDGVRRLLALRDTGRLPRGPRSPAGKTERWLEAIRAFDARRSGASQRDIACLLFGEDRVAEDWNGRSDYMRMRVHRLLRSAELLVAGGYRALFGLGAARRTARPAHVWRSTAWSLLAAATTSLWTVWSAASSMPASCWIA